MWTEHNCIRIFRGPAKGWTSARSALAAGALATAAPRANPRTAARTFGHGSRIINTGRKLGKAIEAKHDATTDLYATCADSFGLMYAIENAQGTKTVK